MAYEKLRIVHNQKEEGILKRDLFLAGENEPIEQTIPIPNGIESILIFDFGGDEIQTPEGPKYHNPFLERDLKKIGIEYKIGTEYNVCAYTQFFRRKNWGWSECNERNRISAQPIP